ncbi:MAG: helix-turn-helix transcriptional regulator [Planctomycetia bacterium]|nr:helix-turn-helix transcriptional regulator [Planctomycetia bacterium]
MSTQIIKSNGKPVFAVLPYEEYRQMRRRLTIAQKRDEKVSIPLDVAEKHLLEGVPLIRAWRIYLGKTQKELAAAIGVSQSAWSQMENSEKNHAETLEKIAVALGIQPEQLTLKDVWV